MCGYPRVTPLAGPSRPPCHLQSEQRSRGCVRTRKIRRPCTHAQLLWILPHRWRAAAQAQLHSRPNPQPIPPVILTSRRDLTTSHTVQLALLSSAPAVPEYHLRPSYSCHMFGKFLWSLPYNPADHRDTFTSISLHGVCRMSIIRLDDTNESGRNTRSAWRSR